MSQYPPKAEKRIEQYVAAVGTAPQKPSVSQSTRPALPKLLTVRQVCTSLSISRTTLYRRGYRYTKERGGRKRLYYASDIELALGLNTVNN